MKQVVYHHPNHRIAFIICLFKILVVIPGYIPPLLFESTVIRYILNINVTQRITINYNYINVVFN